MISRIHSPYHLDCALNRRRSKSKSEPQTEVPSYQTDQDDLCDIVELTFYPFHFSPLNPRL